MVANNNRVLSIDMSRGIAIVLVVWAHADISLMSPTFYTGHLELIHNVIYSFHMPFFFLISAALLRKTIDKYDLDWPGLFKKLGRSLLIPFYSLGMCFIIINTITEKIFHSLKMARAVTPTVGQMLTAMLVRQSDTEKLPSGVLWFLFSLFIFAIIVYAMLKKSRVNEYIVLTVAILLKLFYPYFDSIQVLGLNRIPYYFVFYVVGYMKSAWILNDRTERPTLILPILLIVWYLGFTFMPFQGPLFDLICGMSGSFFLLCLSISICHLLSNGFVRSVSTFGKKSLLIYVFHMPFFVIIRKMLYTYDIASTYAGFGLSVTAGVLLPLMLGKVLSYNKALYGALFGKAYLAS